MAQGGLLLAVELPGVGNLEERVPAGEPYRQPALDGVPLDELAGGRPGREGADLGLDLDGSADLLCRGRRADGTDGGQSEGGAAHQSSQPSPAETTSRW